jgi:hypothetical protein
MSSKYVVLEIIQSEKEKKYSPWIYEFHEPLHLRTRVLYKSALIHRFLYLF